MPDENPKYQQLEERIIRLEAKVRYLEEQKEGKSISNPVLIDADSDTVVFKKTDDFDIPESEISGSDNDDWFQLDENWLNRIGISLLLLGVVFLFKYSIDQGWLIPPVRSMIGLGIGFALFISGMQIKDADSSMPQILLGGGVGVFYITGFATYQLYDFISAPLLWGFMIVVTLLALSLSLQQNQAILSVIGVLGGLGTPFMLYTGHGVLYSLIIYTSVVLAGATVIYLYKGWKSLLWAMVVGGWLVMLVGYFNNIVDVPTPALSDQWPLQIGIFVCLICFWIIPVIREMLSRRNPQQWPDPSLSRSVNFIDKKIVLENNATVSVMSLITPVSALLYSTGIWSMSWESWGVIAMAGSLMIGYTYLPLRSEELPGLASVHGFTALIMLTLSFFLLLEGEFLFFVFALEALGLRFIANNTADEKISFSSHILFGIVAVWMVSQFTEVKGTEWPVMNLDALVHLGIIGIAGLAVPIWLKNQQTKMTYRLAAHLALLGWFLNEFSGVDNGQAYVSVCWGIYALVILVIGFVRGLSWLRLAGMVTIFLVVAKLVFVDLSQLKAIWRILLFIGFGVVFLLIGYLVQTKFGTDQNLQKVRNKDKNI